MEQRLSLVTLGVADLSRAKDFYVSLGLTPAKASTEQVVFFQLNGIALALFPRSDLAADAGVAPYGEGFSGIALAHNVRSREDVDRLLAKAETMGGRILRAAQEASWGGYTGYFADPDGHVWEVAFNPYAVIGDDGSFHISEDD
ncbi:hypothetical protein FHS78_002554 [Parvibaculum indicum]|uniref:VOC family protein n=1 Tax=Parvibaculum indicum TaxID=562969 RepID=UPI001424A600|nr:VOC family protein [Parvibaculum indicum]NIJ42261.1 hypothetical protein [Parvibaculum indicum]